MLGNMLSYCDKDLQSYLLIQWHPSWEDSEPSVQQLSACLLQAASTVIPIAHHGPVHGSVIKNTAFTIFIPWMNEYLEVNEHYKHIIKKVIRCFSISVTQLSLFFSYLISEVGKVCWYCCLNQDYCTILWLWICLEQCGHENWWQKLCPHWHFRHHKSHVDYSGTDARSIL
jgi:hypothetical protein